MSQTPETVDLTRFDVRDIPCRAKHGRIFQRWADLPVGAHFVLINDHDPVPLYYQFAAQFPGAFAWDYLVADPDEFQVKITRTAASPAVAVALPPRPSPGNAPACSGASSQIDLRGLEPPEPMLRILEATEKLAAGATLSAVTDRRPLHLYPELDARGVRYTSEALPDGSWLTRLAR
jgi:uncharacterized protein (DUF2249 family)